MCFRLDLTKRYELIELYTILSVPSLFQVRGQVRSECLTCTFRASCCSARRSRAQVLSERVAYVAASGTGGKKGEEVRGDRLHWRVQESTSGLTMVGAGTREYKRSDQGR